jgi:hypothetical protein
MISVQVQHYLSRARDFLKGMDFLKDDLVRYRYSAALLGIHGAISYCDALRIGLGGQGLDSENHQAASGDLRKRLSERKIKDFGGVDKLGRILAMKSKIAYSSDLSSENDVKQIVLRVERFALWAETTGHELKIEGWGYDGD